VEKKMFNNNNNAKDDYKRERDERLANMDSLNKQAQDDFNDSFFNRDGDFDTHHDKSTHFETHEDNSVYEDEKKSSMVEYGEEVKEEVEEDNKKIGIVLLAVGAIGILGYLGVNYLQNDTKPTPNSPAVASDKETKESVAKNEDNTSSANKENLIAKVEPATVTTATPTKEPTSKSIKADETAPIEGNDKNVIIIEDLKKPSKTADNSKSQKDKRREEEESKIVTEVIKKIKERESKIAKKSQADEVDKEKSQNNKRVAEVKKVEKKVVKREVKRVVKKVVKRAKPKRPQYRVITIKKGDTLASLAERFYGNPMDFKRIIRANRDIRRASSSLKPGQKVIIPNMEKHKQKRLVSVRKGDTLASIAERFYGSHKKYQKIIDANYKIKNKHTPLHVGQLIYVPR
jgi:nucleoid-associated protein YgaU